MEISQVVLEAFQIEHKEQLEGIRTFLSHASEHTNGDDPGLSEAYRLAHSLKGGARVCSLKNIESMGHNLENLFAEVRDGTILLNQEVSQTISAMLNEIEDCMAAIQNISTPQASNQTTEQLDCLLASDSQTTVVDSEISKHPDPDDAIVPSQDWQGSTNTLDTIRLRAHNLDQILQSSDQLQSEVLSQDLVGNEWQILNQHIQDLQREWDCFRDISMSSIRELSKHTKFSRLVRYLDFQDHQIRQIVRQEHVLRRRHRLSTWAMRKCSQDLQRDVRSARLITADTIYQSFRKMMRDLACDEGKDVIFEAKGLDIEADRMVLQALKDPLMHVLRNSVAHGIESPEIRKRAGKPEAGQVTLSLQTIGNQLQLTVEDDGAGINLEAIRERAINSNLLSRAQCEKLTDDETTRLIFNDGLSTKTSVDQLAGRGMGLSVVADSVTRLQGEVTARSGPNGIGMTVRIIVPVSIATHRLLLVSCQKQPYALPMNNVSRLLLVKQSEIETIEGFPVIRVDQTVIPLVDLSDLLGLPADDDVTEAGGASVVLVKCSNRTVGIRVHTLIGERDTVVKELTGPASGVKLFSGCISAEDRSWILVINPQNLNPDAVTPIKQSAKTKELPASTLSTQTPCVLVVDDSFTTRTLEKSILEAHGYSVLIAVDGNEALKKLQIETVDLVISDVEMPRLDGFGLLEALKKNPRTRSIPVIMVTSCDKQEDRQRGLELGADAYLIKQKFDHQELLSVIKQCV